MILVIDNYDSFVHNLGRYFQELDHQVLIRRHDDITLDEITALAPSHIVLSPGPGTPDDAGICVDVIKHFAPTTPILGICLGHQAIGQAFGGQIVRAAKPMHGKQSMINHDRQGIFAGLNDLRVGRYHSLVVENKTLPDTLSITATTNEGDIMGISHKHYPTHGLQFHPESILTEQGHILLKQFLAITDR